MFVAAHPVFVRELLVMLDQVALAEEPMSRRAMYHRAVRVAIWSDVQISAIHMYE